MKGHGAGAGDQQSSCKTGLAVSCPTCSAPSMLLYAAGLALLLFLGSPERYAGLALAILSFFLPALLRIAKRKRRWI